MMYRCFSCTGWKILLLVLWFACAPARVGLALNCMQCHESAAFGGAYTHQPVQRNQCNLCHSLHASRHVGLLHESEGSLCARCHAEVRTTWAEQAFSHGPVRKGQCTSCHAPHASSNPALLQQEQGAVCATCHPGMDEVKGKQHAPFRRGQCAGCHAVHGSEYPGLLNAGGADLCLPCHKPDSAWQRHHLGRNPAALDCLECHHPHASEKDSLLRVLQHEPFAAGDCSGCHAGNKGEDLCLECHAAVLPQFKQVHTHLQGQGDSGCTACHSPHASSQKGLLKGIAGSVCRNCHADKLERRKEMLHLHPQANRCSDCHTGHGSNEPYMLRGGKAHACDACHGEHSTFTHPLGEDALDPRTGAPMDCISCHAPCTGTMFEHNLRGGRERGLCLPCHAGY